MPLHVVTGPANAEKARVVLGRLRAALDREPILVVPTFPDVERYRQELAEEGTVFGAAVETFDRLLAEIARRVGLSGAPLGPLARERVAAAAAVDLRHPGLRASAGTAGFAAAACRLFDELEEERVTPQRLTTALRRWAEDDPGRAAYGEDLARLYAAYRARLERLGRRDAPLHQAAALDALREQPTRWGPTPVLFYGFDDLRPLQVDAVLALARTDAEVTVSLTYEPGRHAFAARGEAFHLLDPAADTREVLAPRDAHYAPGAGRALHHLERTLFEEPAAAPSLFEAPADVAAGDAVVFMEGGGERAELELVAAEALRLVEAGGVAPEEIAVVLRRPGDAAALVEQVFAGVGLPVAVAREARFGHTPLGRGLVSLLRAATGGTAADVLGYLRTPGRVAKPFLVDRLERDLRRAGVRDAAGARARWEADRFPLDVLDRVAAAERSGPAELLARLDEELHVLFAAPHRRTAPVLDGAQAGDAQLLGAGVRALRDLADVAAADPGLIPDARSLADLLDALPVRLGERSVPGAVTVSDPLGLRARRVRVLFACRLQEAVFPAPARPEPFLDDEERKRLAVASGLRLRMHEDALGAERYLLYATVSRPSDRLVLSWHAADDEGDPVVRSPFVDDVAGLFADRPLERAVRRDLGAVGGPGARGALREAAFREPRVREQLAQPLRHPDVLEGLRSRPAWSASGLEAWAGCPVKWFVERLLTPEELEPDAEPLLRGNLAHRVLEQAVRRLVEGGTLTPARLPEAREAVRAALEEIGREMQLSADPSRERATRRRLEADLLRYVEAAAYGSTRFVPALFEETFEGLDLGEGVVLRGTIDRIDVRDAPGGRREAILVDYKGKNAPEHTKWLSERKFQLALYALAARRLLDLEPVGALYQPLGHKDVRARGALVDGADPDRFVYDNDVVPRDEFEALLDDAVAAALQAAREARAGDLEPRPDTCAWRGGCAYPTICRCAR